MTSFAEFRAVLERERMEKDPSVRSHTFTDEMGRTYVIPASKDCTILERGPKGIFGEGGQRCVLITEDEIRAVCRLGRWYTEIHVIRGDEVAEQYKIETLKLLNQFYDNRFPLGPSVVGLVPLSMCEQLDPED